MAFLVVESYNICNRYSIIYRNDNQQKTHNDTVQKTNVT